MTIDGGDPGSICMYMPCFYGVIDLLVLEVFPARLAPDPTAVSNMWVNIQDRDGIG